MIESVLGTSFAIISLFYYFDLRKIAGYAWLVDILLFFGLTWIFIGTYGGMVTGMMTSAIITIFLRVTRKSVGYKTIKLARRKGDLFPRLHWVTAKQGDNNAATS